MPDRFTMVTDAPRVDPEVVAQWQEELQRNLGRMKNFTEMVANPKEPSVGPTPRQEIYRKNKSRLYRYDSRRKFRTPLLFVPNLGISRPYIFDLLPGGGFIEHMTREGFDFYLLYWGVFGPADHRLTRGGPLSACFIATHAEVPVKNFVNMAGPIDFSKVGLFGVWLDPRYFDADRFVDTLGQIPADMVKAGFKLLRPTMDLTTGLNLWWNLWNDSYVEGFQALNKWANEYVAFPGEFFRQWVKEFYQQNRMIRGELRLGGKPVRLGEIRCPVFVVGAKEDYIAPAACVKALIDAVGSTDKGYVELPGGHISLIAGRGASVHCWPKVSAWLAPRS